MMCKPTITNLWRRFAADRSANVAMLFALSIVPIVSVVGTAVDYGQVISLRSRMQNGLDAAALAAGREYQLSKSTPAAQQAATAYFSNALVGESNVQLTNVSVDGSTKIVTVTASGWVPTPFLSVIGIQSLAVEARSESTIEIGENSPVSYEISIMLDVTGSMSGNKISDLKLAAKDLVDIVVWDNQSARYSKIALAPFSDAVRPGPYLAAVRGSRPSTNRFENEGRWHTYQLTDCVSERDGEGAYTDIAPDGNNKLGPVYTKTGACTPDTPVVPLTRDKVLLKSTIDSLSAGGWTAGHIGTAWAWYLISPNWGHIWPADSRPANYGDRTVRKVAILMTDGEYNVQYDAAGVASRDSGRGLKNGLSDAQARQICDNMKATGIEVYTVGFELREAKAIETMRRCASDANHVFLADDGTALRNAFRDIALKLAKLRLTK